jgi:hypothetical protein
MRADGSCEFSTFDQSCVISGRPDPGLVSRSEPCRWSLVQENSRHELLFDVRGQRRGWELTEEQGKLLIFEYVCDPDQWEYAEFEKVGGA